LKTKITLISGSAVLNEFNFLLINFNSFQAASSTTA
jgi:hypothetical protein